MSEKDLEILARIHNKIKELREDNKKAKVIIYIPEFGDMNAEIVEAI